jgi:hypothetical protein
MSDHALQAECATGPAGDPGDRGSIGGGEAVGVTAAAGRRRPLPAGRRRHAFGQHGRRQAADRRPRDPHERRDHRLRSSGRRRSGGSDSSRSSPSRSHRHTPVPITHTWYPRGGWQGERACALRPRMWKMTWGRGTEGRIHPDESACETTARPAHPLTPTQVSKARAPGRHARTSAESPVRRTARDVAGRARRRRSRR